MFTSAMEKNSFLSENPPPVTLYLFLYISSLSLIFFPFTIVESSMILRANVEVLFLSAPPQNADEHMLEHFCRQHLFTNIFDNSKTSFGDHLLQHELKISRT
jgi:hypothetical protein